MSNLKQLKQDHYKFIALASAAGRRILPFKAPCCGANLESMAAAPGEVWNTGATCHECGAMYWRESTDRQVIGHAYPNGRPTLWC